MFKKFDKNSPINQIFKKNHKLQKIIKTINNTKIFKIYKT
jgi:hypothetical protein